MLGVKILEGARILTFVYYYIIDTAVVQLWALDDLVVVLEPVTSEF